MKLYSCFIQFYSFKQFCSILSFQIDFISILNVVFQSLSHVWLFVTQWSAACQASLSLTISWSWLKLMSMESVMPSNHLSFCHLLIPLPSIFPSIRVCSNKLILVIKWPKYWRFSFSIIPSNVYVRFISFRIDWFNLLAVRGTLKSLLQHYSSKALNSSVLSLLYGPTLTSVHGYWKNHRFDSLNICRQSDVSAF